MNERTPTQGALSTFLQPTAKALLVKPMLLEAGQGQYALSFLSVQQTDGTLPASLLLFFLMQSVQSSLLHPLRLYRLSQQQKKPCSHEH